jgi:RNA polymerase sigma factor (sigma-70 family)
VNVTYSRAGRDDLAILFAEGAIGRFSDAELLRRFASDPGDAVADVAFAALVDRHGPMVLGVCRRVTGDRHAADDAFQAVFLILARKAQTVRLGADDSLGRWLYRVSVRVARRARAEGERQRRMAGDFDGLDPIDPSTYCDRCEQDELRAAIDAEIARLPVRFQSPVVLCYLEGLSQKQAAERLGCPVGTIESRLHRARVRLRVNLARRGLAPAGTMLVAVLESTSRAAVPASTAKRAVAAVARISADGALAAASPSAVTGPVGFYLRSMMMKQIGIIVAFVAIAITTAIGAVGLSTAGGDESKAKPSANEPKSAGGRPEPSLATKLNQLETEYERAERAFQAFYRGSTIPAENLAKATAIQPDYPAFVRRIADLAATAPKDPSVRDAMLWVIRRSHGADDGPRAGTFTLAASWLVQHFGDDPDAVRVGLEFDNWPTFCRDSLLLCFYASAKGRESKGLARLALAQYLERKAMMAEGARKIEGRPTYTHDDLVRADGTLYSEKEVMPDGHYAYLLHLKQCDVNYLRAETDRLYEEVIAEYADVPYVTARDRLLEALLKEPEPKWNGRPLSTEDQSKMAAGIANRRSTLGQVSEARLDDWHNLAVGKLAPDFKGVDFQGTAMKLSDYRGKVVALVFWSTGCGPCVRQIPNEKALVERLKGRPFAMLGVNTDADPEDARKLMEAHGVTWPNWRDGGPGDGPIAKLYHLRGLPTVYVIDAQGKIRSKRAIGGSLDQLVEELVAEREAVAK